MTDAPSRSSSGEFEGRTALITGGSRGIGLAVAQTLVNRGARVVVTARNGRELDRAVAQLNLRGGGRCIGVRGGADDETHQCQAVAAAIDTFGSLDHLVLNAAASVQYGPLVDADLSAVRKVLEVNVTAIVGWVQQTWRQAMIDRGGTVVAVASVGGIVAGPNIGAYNVSKAAAIHLIRQLAVELGPGVRVNAVAPAVVMTDFSKRLYEGREAEVASTYPLGRLGVPEDVAEAVAFLLGDRSAWITGETIVLDGGRTLRR